MTDDDDRRWLAASQSMVLRAIEKAAESDAPCPSNTELGELIAGGSAVVSGAFRALEKKGFITIRRFSRTRQVTIVATGRVTRHDGDAKPHWRDTREATL